MPVSSQGETRRCYYYGNMLRNTFLFHHNSLLRPAWPPHSPLDPFRRPFSSRGPLRRGCRRSCVSNLWVPQCCANHYGRDCRGKSHTLSRPALSPAGRWRCWFSTPDIHECAAPEKGGQNPRRGAPACRGCREQYPEVMTRSSLSLENISSLGCWGYLSDMSLTYRCCQCHSLASALCAMGSFHILG